MRLKVDPLLGRLQRSIPTTLLLHNVNSRQITVRTFSLFSPNSTRQITLKHDLLKTWSFHVLLLPLIRQQHFFVFSTHIAPVLRRLQWYFHIRIVFFEQLNVFRASWNPFPRIIPQNTVEPFPEVLQELTSFMLNFNLSISRILEKIYSYIVTLSPNLFQKHLEMGEDPLKSPKQYRFAFKNFFKPHNHDLFRIPSFQLKLLCEVLPCSFQSYVHLYIVYLAHSISPFKSDSRNSILMLFLNVVKYNEVLT